MASRAAVFELPDECGPLVQVLGNLRESILLRHQSGDDFVADPPHRRLVEGEQLRRDGFFAGRAVFLPAAHERHVAADILLEEPLRIEQIELVILLEDPQLRWLGERSEMDGRWIYSRGNVEKPQ